MHVCAWTAGVVTYVRGESVERAVWWGLAVLLIAHVLYFGISLVLWLALASRRRRIEPPLSH